MRWLPKEAAMLTPRDRSIEAILDRQAQLWESAQRTRPPEAPPLPQPNLCISQRPASGADALASHVAERLGWQVWDRSLVDALHGDDWLGKRVLESLDERLLSMREDMIYHLFVPGHTPATAYLQRLSQLVLSIAMRGHNVFVGRGASFIVPRDWRLSVLVVRSLESRASRYSQEHQLSAEGARRELARQDRSRAEFVSRGFHRDVDDPASHDLCINLDAVELNSATEILVRALALRFPSEPPR
jgi:hypothetical protein